MISLTAYKGIDVSKWQGEINWSKVKNAGIQFAMLRSSFGWGSSYKDKFFEYNYKHAKEVGVAVGAYHYAYATTPEEAIKEADWCYSVIKGKKFEYPIAYDMEENRIATLGKEKISAIEAQKDLIKRQNYSYFNTDGSLRTNAPDALRKQYNKLEKQNLDVRTITLGISLLDCIKK